MKRRDFLKLSMLSTAAGLHVGAVLPVSGTTTQLRIGYQKNGVMVIARHQRVLERKLAADGTDVRWIEFVAGPPLLEAMNAGSIDIGQTGDTPPIFAQAAGAAIVYVAGQPTTNGQGILVRSTSDIRNLVDLKGKRVGFTRGSSAHNVVIVALEANGLTYGDITPIYLSPPDAAAAFSRETIDAWAIWDPYFAIGERNGGRILVQSREITKTNSFYVANRDFAAHQPDVVRRVIDALAEAARWAEANRDNVAKILAEVTGLDLDIQTIAADRSSFAVGDVTEDIITTQQAVADRFQKLGLIPRHIDVRDAVWTPVRS
jgi:sulfonate transport system substrate-binding protein